MESDRDLEIANLQALIELRRQEERRLQGLIADPTTAREVRSQVQIALSNVLQDIQVAKDELMKL